MDGGVETSTPTGVEEPETGLEDLGHPRGTLVLVLLYAVIFALSAASAQSVFCAWELGWAAGRGTPVRVVRLDETPPPASIQHLHLSDSVRFARNRPWLDADEARLLALLDALSTLSDSGAAAAGEGEESQGEEGQGGT